MNLEDLYSKAAKGDDASQYDLGMLFIKGEHVAQDYAEAAHWLHQGAKQGSKDAQFVLGALFQKGLAVDLHAELAVHWYELAAEGGHAEAQFNLGYCFEIGEGVAQNLETAVKWYRLSASQGDQDAADALKELGVELQAREATAFLGKKKNGDEQPAEPTSIAVGPPVVVDTRPPSDPVPEPVPVLLPPEPLPEPDPFYAGSTANHTRS